MKIKLSELRQMVKSVIKEETATSKTYKYPTPVNKRFLDASRKPFNATGTNWNGEYKVIGETLLPNGNISIKTVEPIELIFNCKNKEFYMNKTKVSNFQNYIKELQSRFCDNINKINPAGGISIGAGKANTPTPSFFKQKVRLYKDEANTVEAGFPIDVIDIHKYDSGLEIVTKAYNTTVSYFFKCEDNFITAKGEVGKIDKFYNKKYIADLKKFFCTTSAGGKPVINIGTYSQTDQTEPMNVAESQLRKIVKSIIKEEKDCGCSK
jgi:hypothetical protein